MFENSMQHVVDGDYTPFGRRHFIVQDLGARCRHGESAALPLTLASTALNIQFTSANAGYGEG